MGENPFQYDNHVSLIKELKETGDIDETRKARERMAEIFPLTEGMCDDEHNFMNDCFFSFLCLVVSI